MGKKCEELTEIVTLHAIVNFVKMTLCLYTIFFGKCCDTSLLWLELLHFFDHWLCRFTGSDDRTRHQLHSFSHALNNPDAIKHREWATSAQQWSGCSSDTNLFDSNPFSSKKWCTISNSECETARISTNEDSFRFYSLSNHNMFSWC